MSILTSVGEVKLRSHYKKTYVIDRKYHRLLCTGVQLRYMLESASNPAEVKL